MKKILCILLILSIMITPVFAETEVKTINLEMKIYYEGVRQFKIRIYAYDDEVEETFLWIANDDGDTRRWEATNLELKIDNKLEKVDIPFKVWYEGEREARIRVYGYDEDEEIDLTWTDSDEGNYRDWNPSINYEFEITEEEVNLEDIRIWKNLTLEMAQSRKSLQNITEQCYKIVRLNNETHTIATDYADLQYGVGNMEAKLEACRNESAELMPYKRLYDDCASDKVTCVADKKACLDAKQSCEEQGGSNWLVYGVIGIAIGYFLGKRKESKPPELDELGDTSPLL